MGYGTHSSTHRDARFSLLESGEKKLVQQNFNRSCVKSLRGLRATLLFVF